MHFTLLFYSSSVCFMILYYILLSFLLFLPLKHQKQKKMSCLCAVKGDTALFSVCALILSLCFFFSMCCVLGHSSFISSSCCFLLFLLPPLKYKKYKKMCSLMCVVEGDTALFFSLLLFVLLLPHVSCRSMALLYC